MSGAVAQRALDTVDRMPRNLRECVHEFGLPIVAALMDQGVTEPRNIRYLVHSIWAGARQGGQRTGARDTLDWILARAEGPISAKTLYRLLASNGLAIVPLEATRAMLDASMSEVSGFNVKCSREEKHRRRLRAAIRVAMEASLNPTVPEKSNVSAIRSSHE